MPHIKVILGGDRRKPSRARALRNIERHKYLYDQRTYGHAVRMRDVLAEQQAALFSKIFRIPGQ